ncbi:SimX4 [Serratia rubidaea]|uniref:metallophosphoesterase family protein n=1 Tax=Serratia rubidaea TaxID=61652 RepID=UPI000772EB2E|nr:metallophosphoesterase [Serratia rubidaea]AML57739.1 SimX4 [Serratia rubidaea]
MRILALSDIHVDQPENLAWLAQLSRNDYREDVLLLAGDVSHDATRFADALSMLRQRFAQVFFVPGNHDLWLMRHETGDSLAKFHRLLALCQKLGVCTQPQTLDLPERTVTILPLFSWYTRPEEGEDSLYVPSAQEQHASHWCDNYLIRWPDTLGITPARYFLRLNEPHLAVCPAGEVITFSHFLPRRELMLSSLTDETLARVTGGSGFNFSRVAGTALLDRQIRRAGATRHIYGHQHRNRVRPLAGVTYLSCCLGYVAERNAQRIDLRQGAPLDVFSGAHDHQPIEESGQVGTR